MLAYSTVGWKEEPLWLALPVFQKVWPETHQGTSSASASAGLLRLCLELAVFSSHTNQEPESGDLIGNRWFQMKWISVGCGPVGCWIRTVPIRLGVCARLKRVLYPVLEVSPENKTHRRGGHMTQRQGPFRDKQRLEEVEEIQPWQLWRQQRTCLIPGLQTLIEQLCCSLLWQPWNMAIP